MVFFLSACVSVNLGPKGGERSREAEFSAPNAPYGEFRASANQRQPADHAWQNTQNGNSISFFSTCHDPADPPLDTLAQELFAELSELQKIKSQVLTYNGREALDQEVEGKVDGVTTRIRAVIFKKNNCVYTITNVGLPKFFEADRLIFEQFLARFHVP